MMSPVLPNYNLDLPSVRRVTTRTFFVLHFGNNLLVLDPSARLWFQFLASSGNKQRTMAFLRFFALISTILPLQCVTGFTATRSLNIQNAFTHTSSLKAAESEVSFEELDGKDMRIGIIRTRWNDEHVTNLVDGCRKALKECNVTDANIFETSVPGSYELPLAAKFLAMSGRVDAIVCAGVLIKGDTMHFEYICDAVSKGLMNVGIQVSMPIVFGVLTCLDEKQVIARSTGDSNHGYDWGKTAVEMALLRSEATGALKALTKSKAGLEAVGMGVKESKEEEAEKKKVGFF